MGQVKSGGIYYGWVIVGISMLVAFVISGARMSFSPSFKPMLLDYDTNRGLLSLAMSINQLFYGLAGPVTGWLTDRYGARTIILISALITAVGLVGTSLAPNLWVLYIAYGVFTGFGFSGTTTIPFSALITRWFRRKSGLALGVSTTGTPIGHMFIVPIATYVILGWGWRYAYAIVGAVIALVIAPLAWRLVKGDPKELGLLPDGDVNPPAVGATLAGAGGTTLMPSQNLAQAMRTRPYWLLCIGWFTCGFVGFMVSTHLVPFATDVGMGLMEAALVLSLMGAFSAIGSLGSGALSDWIGRKNPLTAIYFTRFLAFPLIMLPAVSSNHILVYLFAMVFGIGMLATLPLASTLVREIYGQQSMGVILGTILLVHQIGAAMGVYMGGAIFDATGSYFWAFLMSSVLSLVAAVASFKIRETPRPVYIPRAVPAE